MTSDRSSQKILITQPLPSVATDWLLEQGAELFFGYEDDSWKAHAADIPAIVYYSIQIDREFMDQIPNLKIIGKRGAGIDRIDLEEARKRDILITNVAGANSNAVAEHSVMLLFAATRGVVVRDEVARRGDFEQRFDLPLSREIASTKAGFVGFGNIGRRIAEILRSGLGCDIGYFDPYLETEVADARRFDSVLALMEWSDNAVIAAPLTPETRGMVQIPELEALGDVGVLVVISRGGIVDEDALVEALRSKRLGGAGVDVYDPEPPREDHPLFGLSNVILTPHVAGATDTSRERSSLLVCQRVWALLHGEEAPLVGRESWVA